MAGKRAYAHEELRHAVRTPLFRGGVTAGEDLRVGKPDGTKIRPSVLQMLFTGGSVKPPGKPSWQPGLYGGGGIPKPAWQPGLFRGGRADRQLAVDDTRLGRHENVRPVMGKMLFRGGPAKAVATEDLRMHHDGEDEIKPANFKNLDHGGEVDEFSSEEKLAAHEVMSALKSGDAMSFLKAMKGLWYLMDDDGAGAGDEMDDGE
jgi:hypothetical protein